MKTTFPGLLHQLQSLSTAFDEASVLQLREVLHQLRNTPLPLNPRLLDYYNCLLFLCAYPANNFIFHQAERELRRIAHHIRRHRKTKHRIPLNEGLPWLATETSFSPEFGRWLNRHPDIRVQLGSDATNNALSLNEVLNLGLTSLLRAETTAGLSNDQLLARLRVVPRLGHAFLLQQMQRLHHTPLLEDLLFEKAGITFHLQPKSELFSRARNRLSHSPPFVHHELLKNFDHQLVYDAELPSEKKLSIDEHSALIHLIKNAMALTARETDPATFLDPSSLKMFDLERGLSVCIYGIAGERQLPLASYMGFTLLKNGFPCSYGGSWIFGTRANFGINIFEPFRGGESGYILCQLLRLYKQIFHLSVVEVEQYQIGLDNPEGISSAAFWFYYRYGFRPVDRSLKTLAATEHEKIRKRKNYRSSATTLRRLAQSPIRLSFATNNTIHISEITNAVLRMIAQRFDNDHSRAEQECEQEFIRNSGINLPDDPHRRRVLTEVSLWAQAKGIQHPEQLRCMCAMIDCRGTDQYSYQELIRQFFSVNI